MTTAWDRREAGDQQRVQHLLLRRWVEEAVSFSPFWSRRFEALGIDPASLTSAETLRQLPPARELDLVGIGGPGSPGLLMRPTEDQVKAQAGYGTLIDIARNIRRAGPVGKRMALLAEYKPVHLHESGRDGRLAVAYTRSDLDRLHRTGARAAAVLGLEHSDYLVSAVPAGPRLQFWGLYHLALGSSMLALHARAEDGSLGHVVRAFRLVAATVVAVRLEDAIELADLLRVSRANVSRVTTVLLLGPPPGPGLRQEIIEAWRLAGANANLRALALWAPPGARTLWAECEPSVRQGGPGTGLHVYPDLEVVELVDPSTGRTVAAGGGDLTYTSLGWHGTALLRYQTGDHATGMATEPCPACGRTVPRVLPQIVPAAWEPLLSVNGRSVRVDLRGAAAVLTADPAVDAWRVEVRGAGPRRPGDAYVVVISGRQLDPSRLVELDRRLAAAVGYAPLQLVVDSRPQIENRIAEMGGALADRR